MRILVSLGIIMLIILIGDPGSQGHEDTAHDVCGGLWRTRRTCVTGLLYNTCYPII